jgi:hypothetical protein
LSRKRDPREATAISVAVVHEIQKLMKTDYDDERHGIVMMTGLLREPGRNLRLQ